MIESPYTVNQSTMDQPELEAITPQEIDQLNLLYIINEEGVV